jgi:hypothetical protein
VVDRHGLDSRSARIGSGRAPNANHQGRSGVCIDVRIVLAIAAVVAVLVAVVGATGWLDDDDGAAKVAGVRLAGTEPVVQGAGFFEQDGEHLTGFIAVWGLEPNSDHAVHFHGPDGRCGTKADPVAAHADLKADGNGIAYANVDLSAEQDLLGGGFYYNVHEGPSRVADNPEIACVDIHA